MTINVEFLSSDDRDTLTSSKDDLKTNWDNVDLNDVKANLEGGKSVE